MLWHVLEKKGCWDTPERIALLGEFVDIFGASAIAYLCAEREFIGTEWFAYLRQRRIGFRLRVRSDTQPSTTRGRKVAAQRLFANYPVRQAVDLPGARALCGATVYVAGVCCGCALGQSRVARRCRGRSERQHVGRVRGTLGDRNLVWVVEDARLST